MSTITQTNPASQASNISSVAKPAVEQAQTDAEKTSGDYEDFLLLLTAQMKNQDPLKPMDSTNFVSQLAQFSNVEQQVKMNSKLDGLVSSLSQDSFSDAGSYLGKYITTDNGKTYVKEDITSTSFSYQTDPTVKSVTALITDRFGNHINDISLPLSPNGRSHEWNLKDKNDEKVEQGLYNITLQLKDEAGKITTLPAQTKAKIIEAQKGEDGFSFLTDTGVKIKANEIKTVHAS